ncbi:hypothetical protein [Labilibaculum antarcticum]|uniref:Uncharacterized protein n=1 Tax=Labilibaculum antarcticum TaxID=1717717 RepID=A0A1Y1CJS9_9BACT|nr:hypothetical protein [Labilibaculum antarcticum]BAX80648.1 hypothetical protein ALGA_2316 [Labilibaculum antarcticum]
MEEEKSSIQLLKDFAKKSGRTIEFAEQAYDSCAMQPIVYHERSLYIPNHSNANTYFVCYNNPKSVNGNDNYSGVFFTIPVPKSTKVLVRKRFFFDKLNFFSKSKAYKTGTDSFDSQVVFEESDFVGGDKIFTNSKVQELIKKAFQFDKGLRIAINSISVDFVPELKGHSHFGIFVTQNWFVEPEKIEMLFQFVEKIRSHVIREEETGFTD